MAFREIGSAEPKYLAATDILIGDMSNTNYEFLLYDRPLILLANDWVRKYFPDIGIKADLDGLKDAIYRSIGLPDEFKQKRQFWLNKTIYRPYEKSASRRYIDIILDKTGFKNPFFVLLHGNDSVRKTNLVPLREELELRQINCVLIDRMDSMETRHPGECIYVGAHFEDLNIDVEGVKVHIDHDLKGRASANISVAIRDYKAHRYFPNIDLHITPGEAGDRRTRLVLGPLSDRTIIGGYPKADALLELNGDTKIAVYRELGLEFDKPLITYAPAGERSYMKPGGSLNRRTVQFLNQISDNANFHVLVKRKYEVGKVNSRLKYLKRVCRKIAEFGKLKLMKDCGPIWNELFKDLKDS